MATVDWLLRDADRSSWLRGRTDLGNRCLDQGDRLWDALLTVVDFDVVEFVAGIAECRIHDIDLIDAIPPFLGRLSRPRQAPLLPNRRQHEEIHHMRLVSRCQQGVEEHVIRIGPNKLPVITVG